MGWLQTRETTFLKLLKYDLDARTSLFSLAKKFEGGPSVLGSDQWVIVSKSHAAWVPNRHPRTVVPTPENTNKTGAGHHDKGRIVR